MIADMFYPMRPMTGACAAPTDEEWDIWESSYDTPKLDPRSAGWQRPFKRILRPKPDGSRVVVKVGDSDRTSVAWNRHGEPYSKAHKLPWTELREAAEMLNDALKCRTDILDIEFFDKHKYRKGECAIIDIPHRSCTFGAAMKGINDTIVTIRSQEPLIRLPVCVRAKVNFLTYWNPDDVEVDVKAQWKLLKKHSIAIMKEWGESTPFYEGMVAVERDSHYNIQTVSPTVKTRSWVKHRFST